MNTVGVDAFMMYHCGLISKRYIKVQVPKYSAIHSRANVQSICQREFQ